MADAAAKGATVKLASSDGKEIEVPLEVAQVRLSSNLLRGASITNFIAPRCLSQSRI